VLGHVFAVAAKFIQQQVPDLSVNRVLVALVGRAVHGVFEIFIVQSFAQKLHGFQNVVPAHNQAEWIIGRAAEMNGCAGQRHARDEVFQITAHPRPDVELVLALFYDGIHSVLGQQPHKSHFNSLRL
jgi:hypothetical protein